MLESCQNFHERSLFSVETRDYVVGQEYAFVENGTLPLGVAHNLIESPQQALHGFQNLSCLYRMSIMIEVVGLLKLKFSYIRYLMHLSEVALSHFFEQLLQILLPKRLGRINIVYQRVESVLSFELLRFVLS